ncbi:MAG: ferredoxin family protein [Myxococcota bacterium]
MAYVVTRLCQGCKDTACATVCPVECFYEANAPSAELPDQLYIHPDECIDCDACVPECPWDAIYKEEDVPEIFKDDTALNKLCMDRRAEFKGSVQVEKPKPTPDQREANKRKWGLT